MKACSHWIEWWNTDDGWNRDVSHIRRKVNSSSLRNSDAPCANILGHVWNDGLLIQPNHPSQFFWQPSCAWADQYAWCLLERSSFSCLYVIIEATISLYQQQSNGTEVNQHILYDNHRTRANWFDNRLGLSVVSPIRNSTCQRTEVSDETAVKQRWSDWQLESVPSLVTDDE